MRPDAQAFPLWNPMTVALLDGPLAWRDDFAHYLTWHSRAQHPIDVFARSHASPNRKLTAAFDAADQAQVLTALALSNAALI